MKKERNPETSVSGDTLEKRLSSLWDTAVPDAETAERLRARVMKAAESEIEAEDETKARRGWWNRLRIPAAACLLLAFGMSGFLLFREAGTPRIYTYTTEAGETVAFPESKAVLSAKSIAFDYPVVVRPLTKSESDGLFGTVSIVRGDFPLANDDLVWRGGSEGGYGYEDAPDFSNGIANDDLVWRDLTVDWVDADYRGELPEARGGRIIRTADPAEGGSEDGGGSNGDDLPAESERSDVWGTFREDSGEMIRAEGRLGTTRIAAAAPGIAVSDTVIAGESGSGGEVSRIGGVDVTFVRFTTAPNSRGERTVVLGASFPLTVEDGAGGSAEWTVTAEQAGDAGEPDAAAEALIRSVKSILSAPHEAVRNEGGSEREE